MSSRFPYRLWDTRETPGEMPAPAARTVDASRSSPYSDEYAGSDIGLRAWPYVAPSGERDRIALVLAGGGLTGAVYEVGALRAIDDLLMGLSVKDFDIFVGTSAGALVSSFIANGLSPRDVMQALDNRHPELHGLRVGDLFRWNLDDGLRSLSRLPHAAFTITRTVLGNLGDLAVADLIWEVTQILPPGIYNGNALEQYVRAVLDRPGYTNRFAELDKEFYIVATELDSGARAIFGRGHLEEVPISLAVAASSAVPILYRPVQVFEKDYVDGFLHGAASLDLAIEAGAKLIVCINPMVPFDAAHSRPHEHYIRQHGLQAVINQSLRTLMHSSLKYHIKNVRMKYPDVDIILIQPGLDDLEMFSHNPMHYSGRLAVAQHGFESVTNGILANIDYYRSVLARHSIDLHTDLLQAQMSAIKAEPGAPRVVEQIIDAQPAQPTLLDSLSRLEGRMHDLDARVSTDGSGNHRDEQSVSAPTST